MEQAAKEAVRRYLQELAKANKPVTALSYEEAIQRAALARQFVDHPYWHIVSRMLTGTIQAETEELLTDDKHIAVNRASVAMCRKILQMPFFDIEQGRAAEKRLELAMARKTAKTTKAQTSAEDTIPWRRQAI